MRSPVFIVEDDPDVTRLLSFHLQHAGYAPECFTRGSDALTRSLETLPTLFLLDIMLPGEDGLGLCRRIRNSPHLCGVPVIIVSARVSEEERLRGFECGADDYIVKPFSPRELLARIRVALRRGGNQPAVLQFGPIEVDTTAMILRVEGEERKTTAVEFRILEALARSPGRVLTRERLMQLTGSDARGASPRMVDVYITRLREKIEPAPASPRYIETVRGVGYRFNAKASAE